MEAHIYIYYRRKGSGSPSWVYDRSMPSSCMHRAEDRLRVLSKRYGQACFTVGGTIPAFY